MEAQLRGVEVGLDLDKATRDLRQFQAEHEATELAISAVLDPGDLDKLAVRLKSFTDEQREIFFSTEVGLTDVRTNLAELEAKDHVIKLLADLDSRQAQAQIEKLAAEHKEMHIRAVLDLERAKAQIEAAARDREFKLSGTVDFHEAQLAIDKLKFQAEHASVNVDMGADVTRARAEIEKLATEMKGKSFKPNVDVDLKQARASIELFRTLQQNNDIEIPVNANVDQIDAALKVLETKAASGAGDAGKSAGDAFGSGFLDIIPRKMQFIGALVASAAEPIALSLEGVLGGAIEVASSAFSALAGAAGAATPIMVGLAGSLAAVGIASIGMPKALKAVTTEFNNAVESGRAFNINNKQVQTALAQLTPAAKDFVTSFAGLLPTFKGIQQAVSQQVFAGLSTTLTDLSKNVIPDIGVALGLAGQSFNKFVKGLGSAAKTINFGEIMAGLQPALDSVGRGVTAVFKAIGPFLKAASPAARELATMFEKAATSLGKMIEQGAKSGNLAKFLQDGLTSLKAWGGLLRDAGSALFTLFEAGKSGGDSLVTSLDNVIGKFNDWMKSAAGQNALKDFFSQANTVLKALEPILKGLQGMFEGLITAGAVGRFAEFTSTIGALLPFLGELLRIFSELSLSSAFLDAIEALASALQGIVPQLDALATALGQSIGDALTLATPLLVALAEALGIVAQVLTPMAPLIIGVATAWAAWEIVTAIGAAIGGLVDALETLYLSMLIMLDTPLGPFLLALAAAAAVAVAAFSLFSNSNKEVNARAKEVSASLNEQVNAHLKTATSATAAATGLLALNDALASTGKDGDKLTKALGTLGLTTDKALDTLVNFGKGGENAFGALEQLAESAGLSGRAMQELAGLVAGTDDNFDQAIQTTGLYRKQIEEVAKASGKSTDDIIGIAQAMAEVKDQAQKTNLDKMVKDFLDTSSASDDLHQSMLKQAEAQTGLSRTGTDLIGLYEAYTAILGESASTTNDAAQAEKDKAATDAIAAQALKAMQASIEASIASATSLAAAQNVLKSATIDFVNAQGGIVGPVSAASLVILNQAKAAQAAADASNNLKTAFDLLVQPSLDLQAAGDALFANTQKLTDAMKANGVTLDVNTEKGRANREQMRSNVEGILAWAQSATAAGQSQADVAKGVDFLRGGLVNQAGQFFATKEEADKYVSSLGLVPSTATTVIATPGLTDAITNTDTMKTNVEDLNTTATTDINAPNLSPVQMQMQNYSQDIGKVPATAETTVSAPGLGMTADAAEHYVTTVTKDIPTTSVTSYSAPGLTTVQGQLDTYQRSLDDIQDDISTSFHTPGLSSAISDMQTLINKADALDGKVVTIHIQQTGTTQLAMGGIAPPGGAIAGEAGPEIITIGGRSTVINQTTAVPSGTLVTPLTGPGANNGAIGKQVNNYMTITTPTADPVAVAQQIINRAAVLAQR